MGEINGWRLGAALGSGDFATVYQAERDGADAAFKLCHHVSPMNRARIEAEVSALGKLKHQGVPRLLDHGEHEGMPFVVMTRAPGVTVQRALNEKLAVGAIFGDVEVMHLLAALLDIVSHLHEERLVHRDIKDANILVDDDRTVSLIDYGFCKTANTSELRSSDSFFRAGSSRFSPPLKLEEPGRAIPSHDVYAAGVVGYLLLTGQHPWSGPPEKDISALKRLQSETPLVPVGELNSRVDPAVSKIISDLLILNDDYRPAAADALRSVQGVLTSLTAVTRPRGKVSTLAFPNVIRDAVYGDIRLTAEEYEVLDTPEMQRLRPIKQLGLTDMVYPGATHSRLSHSLGSLERVEQLFSSVEKLNGVRIEPEIRIAGRLYALTHDITHVPFGHTLEDEFGFFERHDANVERLDRLIDSPSSLGEVLRKSDSGRVTIELLRGRRPTEWAFLDEIVSGVTGADVLDYVDRDSYYCGLDHKIDSAIFRQFQLHETPGQSAKKLVSVVGGKYGTRADRSFAVEAVLRERYAMFLKVYTHTAKVAASVLLGKALHAALTQRGRRLRQEELEGLGDETLLDLLAKRNPSAWWISQLKARRFPRGVYRAALLTEKNRNVSAYHDERGRLDGLGLLSPEGRYQMEVDLAARAKVDPQHIAIYCPTKAPGFPRVEHWTKNSSDDTPSLIEVTGEYTQRHLGLWDLWVFVIGQEESRVRTTVAEAAQAQFGRQNMITVNRRLGRLF